MGAKRPHGGLEEILREQKFPGVHTTETFVKNRRTEGQDGGHEAFNNGYWCEALDDYVYSKKDLDSKLDNSGLLPAD